tara:strand:+ start:8349 stop:8996 length:648 start_codon:yes stop_codon:yes gene_type:complete
MNQEIPSTSGSNHFTDKQIFTKIWKSPRQVFKFINETKYDKYVYILLFFAGIARAFDQATIKDMGDNMSLWTIIGICVIGGGLLGWLAYYIYAALLGWTGKWLDGKGDTKSILRVLAYALIPSVIALVFLIPQIGIYGIEMFKADGDISSAGLIPNILVYGSMVIELILGIYTLVFLVISVSEVQKLSIGKSILNLILPILVFAVPIILIALFLK